MFAQESVMDIKKEREAFERLPLAELAIESEFVFYNEETNSYWPNEDFCPSDAPETMNFAWEAWQAAKAHEAEKLKGCVVVPDGFMVVNQKDLLELTIAINAVDLATHTESKTNEVREMWQQVALKLMALCTAQEQKK